MANPSTLASSSTADELATTSILHLPQDIIVSDILSRLDGPTLACFGSTCTILRALSTKEDLWAKICYSMWPSTNTPCLRELIASFPRSFFTDAFLIPIAVDHTSQRPNSDRKGQMIFAVDLFHCGKPILSRVVEEETVFQWFRTTWPYFGLLHWSESATGISGLSSDLELTLSWIVIDPIQRRALNISNWKRVSVKQRRSGEDLLVHFGTVIGGGERGSVSEEALCIVRVVVSPDLKVRQVSFGMEGMDGKALSQARCLEILHRALDGERKRTSKEYEEVLKQKNEMSDRTWLW